MPFDEFSGLGTPDDHGVFALADKIHAVSHGFLRQVGYLVRGAAAIAIDENADRVRERHLHASVEDQQGLLQSSLLESDGKGVAIPNPFLTPTANRPRSTVKSGYQAAA